MIYSHSRRCGTIATTIDTIPITNLKLTTKRPHDIILSIMSVEHEICLIATLGSLTALSSAIWSRRTCATNTYECKNTSRKQIAHNRIGCDQIYIWRQNNIVVRIPPLGVLFCFPIFRAYIPFLHAFLPCW